MADNSVLNSVACLVLLLVGYLVETKVDCWVYYLAVWLACSWAAHLAVCLDDLTVVCWVWHSDACLALSSVVRLVLMTVGYWADGMVDC